MATFRLLLILATALFVAFNMSAARAADASSPLVMVASPGLVGSYAKTVLIALPAGNGTHLGFILNRPTQTKLAALLPDYPPAKQVAAPIFIGGPDIVGPLFALVRSASAPGAGSLEVVPGLYLAFQESDVDRVIGSFSSDARFFVGLVTWQVGELEAELGAGAWHVLEPDVDLVLDSGADTLWSRLMARLRSVTT
jgi:putative transcriptional regulator